MTQFSRRSIVTVLGGAALVAIPADAVGQSDALQEATRNKEILTQAYRLWHDTRGGSVGHWMEVADENIVFGSLAEGRPAAPFTARLRGREQLGGYFAGLLDGWEMRHYTVDYLMAEGDRVAMIGSTAWRNKKTNKEFETPKVDIWRFRNGRAIEFYEYFDTAGLVAAAS